MKNLIDPAALTRALSGQYAAALQTLQQCIDMCDDSRWAAAHPDTPVNQVVFHTLFYTDYYLGRGDSGFRQQEFHLDNPELFQDYEELVDRIPENFYSREGCLAYLAHCRVRMETVLAAEDAGVLSGDCGFPRRNLSRLELHIYNIRHIQHHAAQLGLRNQLAGGEALRWVGKG